MDWSAVSRLPSALEDLKSAYVEADRTQDELPVLRSKIEEKLAEYAKLTNDAAELPSDPKLQYSTTGATLRYITSNPDFDALCRRSG